MLKKKKMIRKCRSKKGMTLIELLVGVTIVVIVFASCLGALVNGYTTTMYNSDENRAASLNESVNELIGNMVNKMKISNSEEAADFIDELSGLSDPDEIDPSDYDDSNGQALIFAVSRQIPDIVYVPATLKSGSTNEYTYEFNNNVSYQYTIIPDTETTLNPIAGSGNDPYTVSGFTIKTCFESAAGPITYESFIAYAK